jgi:MoxR-like ATPase
LEYDPTADYSTLRACFVGEPGIGKSRLIEEFHGRLRDTPHTWSE